MDISGARQHFVNKEEEISNTYMSANGNGNSSSTKVLSNDTSSSDTGFLGGYFEGGLFTKQYFAGIAVGILVGCYILPKFLKKK